MRSLVRDSGRSVATVHSRNSIDAVGNASGSGIFSDGTPYRWVRGATGYVDIHFDYRLIPISGDVEATSWGSVFPVIFGSSPGYLLVFTSNNADVPINWNFKVIVNWLDTR